MGQTEERPRRVSEPQNSTNEVDEVVAGFIELTLGGQTTVGSLLLCLFFALCFLSTSFAVQFELLILSKLTGSLD